MPFVGQPYHKNNLSSSSPNKWQLGIVESSHKGGVKENIQENQRGIFLVNTVLKIYESILKIQNENNNGNMSSMQRAG